jgi:hypothetical protein
MGAGSTWRAREHTRRDRKGEPPLAFSNATVTSSQSLCSASRGDRHHSGLRIRRRMAADHPLQRLAPVGGISAHHPWSFARRDTRSVCRCAEFDRVAADHGRLPGPIQFSARCLDPASRLGEPLMRQRPRTGCMSDSPHGVHRSPHRVCAHHLCGSVQQSGLGAVAGGIHFPPHQSDQAEARVRREVIQLPSTLDSESRRRKHVRSPPGLSFFV